MTLQKLQSSSSEQNFNEVAFGIYYANRSLGENLETTYPTLNLVPLKVSVQHDLTILQIARKVQEDLHLISSHSTAGLWEIKDWTGVEINCFVNFLHLDDESTETLKHGDIALEPVSDAREIESLKQTFGSNDASTKCSTRWLSNNAVRDAFPDALDIEASINAGGMDIGVFGASTMASETSANEIIGLLSGLLKEL
ncbi:nonribosomal peptide synthetase 2 [Colletotrichum spaethianum]|uniref:Nonribosomal peptide synthetase 2 n=1 Tax=Colletotrichum spaethianum TaxID=700344 RepID=A0AA37PHJ7_9PEZI|nr:nonribosomal peptide synthetase 2 [Colletotrichum spaethianum]GKT52342.1 nonribosomal peptide synthetase 2 [Colletotrichum spaethianum]